MMDIVSMLNTVLPEAWPAEQWTWTGRRWRGHKYWKNVIFSHKLYLTMNSIPKFKHIYCCIFKCLLTLPVEKFYNEVCASEKA